MTGTVGWPPARQSQHFVYFQASTGRRKPSIVHVHLPAHRQGLSRRTRQASTGGRDVIPSPAHNKLAIVYTFGACTGAGGCRRPGTIMRSRFQARSRPVEDARPVGWLQAAHGNVEFLYTSRQTLGTVRSRTSSFSSLSIAEGSVVVQHWPEHVACLRPARSKVQIVYAFQAGLGASAFTGLFATSMGVAGLFLVLHAARRSDIFRGCPVRGRIAAWGRLAMRRLITVAFYAAARCSGAQLRWQPAPESIAKWPVQMGVTEPVAGEPSVYLRG